jgi:hypothetical protein
MGGHGGGSSIIKQISACVIGYGIYYNSFICSERNKVVGSRKGGTQVSLMPSNACSRFCVLEVCPGNIKHLHMFQLCV